MLLTSIPDSAMTTDVIKEQIISKVNSINDPGLLHAVNTILGSGMKTGILKLSAKQMDEIKASREDIGKDMFLENKLLIKEVNQWLKWR
jgi:hypothetical protein